MDSGVSPDFDIHRTVRILREATRSFHVPAVGRVARQGRDPYRILISCILSLRTQDHTTWKASEALFRKAGTPRAMLRLSEEEIRNTIYPVGFYRRKARVILDISRELLDRFEGKVPSTLEDLLRLKGVGRKTANLVLTEGFGLPGICVDTHVHRIVNRWGYVRTSSPDATEMALRDRLPRKYWQELNELLVRYGQTVCRPLSPRCSVCGLSSFCPRKGVTRHR